MVRDPITRILSHWRHAVGRRLRDPADGGCTRAPGSDLRDALHATGCSSSPTWSASTARRSRSSPRRSCSPTARGRCAGPSASPASTRTSTSEQFDREWEKSTRQGVRQLPVHGEADQAAGLPLLRPQLRPPARSGCAGWSRRSSTTPRRRRRRSRSCPTRSLRDAARPHSARTSPRCRSSPAASSPAGSSTNPRHEDRCRRRRAGGRRRGCRRGAPQARPRADPTRRPRRRTSATTGPGRARPLPATSPRAAPSRRSSAAGPGPAPRSRPTRSTACAPRSASTRRPPTGRAGGTTPTPSRSACGRPPRRSSPRSSTPGSAARPSGDAEDAANVEHLAEIEGTGERRSAEPAPRAFPVKHTRSGACFPSPPIRPSPSSSPDST